MHLTPLSKVKKLSLCFVAEPLGSRSNSEEYSDSLKFDVGDNIVFKLLFHFAALNHVEELCIEGGYLDFADWYHHFSTCRSIKLSGFYEGMWVSHSFEFLKCLEINNFYYPFQLELEGGDVFPTYPLLERLILRGSCFERARITAPKLEYLEMESITVKDDKFISVILLFAPKLASIKLYNVVPALISADDFLSLNKLEVFLDSFTVSVFFYEVEQLVVERLGGLWNLLRKATSLTLNSTVLEVISDFFQFNYPSYLNDEHFMFKKLRHLTLEGNTTKSKHVLMCLLMNSPSLKTSDLEIDDGLSSTSHDCDSICEDFVSPAACDSNGLTTCDSIDKAFTG